MEQIFRDKTKQEFANKTEFLNLLSAVQFVSEFLCRHENMQGLAESLREDLENE